MGARKSINSYLTLSLGPVANQPEANSLFTHSARCRSTATPPDCNSPWAPLAAALLEEVGRAGLAETANQTSLSCKLSSIDGALRARLTHLGA